MEHKIELRLSNASQGSFLTAKIGQLRNDNKEPRIRSHSQMKSKPNEPSRTV